MVFILNQQCKLKKKHVENIKSKSTV